MCTFEYINKAFTRRSQVPYPEVGKCTPLQTCGKCHLHTQQCSVEEAVDTQAAGVGAQEGSVSHGQSALLTFSLALTAEGNSRGAEFLPYIREALSLTLSIGTPQKQRNKNPKP